MEVIPTVRNMCIQISVTLVYNDCSNPEPLNNVVFETMKPESFCNRVFKQSNKNKFVV